MKKIIKQNNFVWVDIEKPSEEDIQFLKNRFKIHSLTAKTIIPAIHYPDLDPFRNYLFLILHYPHYKENKEIKILEFDIIAGQDFLITTHQEDVLPLRTLLDACHISKAKKDETMSKGAGYLLFMILNTFLKDVLEKINSVAADIDKLESGLFAGHEREMIKEISTLKMQIIDIWRIVEPQRLIFESLRATGVNFFGPDYKHYFNILHRTHRRIENGLKGAKETVEALEETNQILVSLKMNEIMKILTLFSVIFMPLTLLASIWGMNTNFLPFQNTDRDFEYVLLIMALTFAGMFMYFKHKKWI
jgi:magnesium transporter